MPGQPFPLRRRPPLGRAPIVLALSLVTSSLHCGASREAAPGAGEGGAAGGGGDAGAGADSDAAPTRVPTSDPEETADAGAPDDAALVPSDDAGDVGAGTQLPIEAAAPTPLFTCDDLGPEPVIPPPCATVLATKAVIDGEPSDETLDSAPLQAAIDRCPAGQSVRLVSDGEKSAFVSGALFMRASVSLWIDEGVTLFASRNPRDFDSKTPGQCGLAASNSACNALINVKSVADVSIVGSGVIDGRGGDVVQGSTSTWWELEELDDGKLAAPRLIQSLASQNLTIYGISLHNAPKFHVWIDGTRGYRVWGITVISPSNSPNTDGVDPSASSDGIIAYNKISTGDDNIAIKAGGGSVNNLVIAHNHFGKGHGMSIGSETNAGVSNVKVCDLSLDGTKNGIRIKSDSSRGGLVRAISYTDVCMRDVGHPLVFDAYYSSAVGTLIPDFQDVTVRGVHVLGAGGSSTFRGYDALHPVVASFDNVVFDQTPTVTASATHLTFGPGAVTFTASGADDVSVVEVPGEAASVRACDEAWTTF